MFHVVLYEPEIPPNTGNIIRLCANTGATLHLIRPLGFDLDDKKLRRAGLDYREFAELCLHDSLDTFFATCNPLRTFSCSTKAQQRYTDICYRAGDALLFGPEGRGLPGPVLEQLGSAQMIRIPMRADSRSLNLANAVAVILYEALRQNEFGGANH